MGAGETRGCRACLATMPASAPVCPACGVSVAPLDAALPPPPLDHAPFQGPEPSAAPAAPSKAPARPSRRTTWLLLLALIGCYLNAAGDAWRHGMTPGQVARSGLLTPATLLDLPHEGWRLIHGSLIHQNPLVLMVTCFLVLRLAGEVERRVGAGSMLFLFTAGGALLNGLRLEFESEASRFVLAGGWPAGCLLGGVALTSALRMRTGLVSVLVTLGIDLTILAMVASSAPSVGLQGALFTAAAGLGLGGVLGSFLPLRRDAEQRAALPGWVLGFLAVCLIGGAESMRASQAPSRAPSSGWAGGQDSSGLAEELSEVPASGLGLSFKLPKSWQAQGKPGVADCGACGAEAGPAPLDKTHVDCPQCGARVKIGAVRQVRYVQGGLWNFTPGHVDVWSWPKGQFDAPDTLAGRRLAEIASGAIPFREPILIEDRSFRGGMGLGHQVVLRVRLDDQGEQGFVFRLYVFVGAERTAYVSTLTPEPAEYEQQLAEQALFDAIARSVREQE